MLTTHAYTNSQALHDEPEKDLRGARAHNSAAANPDQLLVARDDKIGNPEQCALEF